MSTTAIPAYVPRTGSLPPSAASSPIPPPRRQAYVPRSSSATPSANEEARRQADAILKLLNALPAPLSDRLGETFLPVPRPQTPSPPAQSKFSSFKQYARSEKRKVAVDDDTPTVGLGLSGTGSVGPNGLPSRPPLKKARTASGANEVREGAATGGHDLQRAASSSSGLTPPQRASTHLPSPHRPARSSLRNEIKSGTSDWTREQWSNLFHKLGVRAHSLKRAGDAYLSPKTAKGHLRGRVSEDLLRGVLLLTDSLCLYVYRNFVEERINNGHVKTRPYRELQGLSSFVLGRWGSLRTNVNTAEEHKAMIKGMLGLIYLIEAVVHYHVSMADLRSLTRRTKEITASASASSVALPGGSSVPTHGPSPASSSASPGAAGRSPASSAPTELPADMMKQLTESAAASNSASQALLSSRHYLSYRTLREVFPVTWELANTSDLADDILPAVNDTLGAARALDIDDPDTFAWPIELGMQNAVAHVAVFGRALVREFAAAAGKPWEPVMSEVESPEGK